MIPYLPLSAFSHGSDTTVYPLDTLHHTPGTSLKLLSIVMDGENGKGLRLEKELANFFMFSSCVLKKIPKKTLWLALPLFCL